MNNKPAYLSREGLEKLREELDEMVNVRRPEVAARIHEAKEHGDITENAEYEDAKNEQAFVEGRIQALDGAHQERGPHRREPLHRPRPDRLDRRRSRASDGKETYTIVGPAEAAPARGSDLQRVARRPRAAGRKKGDEVTVSVPAGDSVYKIVSIS